MTDWVGSLLVHRICTNFRGGDRASARRLPKANMRVPATTADMRTNNLSRRHIVLLIWGFQQAPVGDHIWSGGIRPQSSDGSSPGLQGGGLSSLSGQKPESRGKSMLAP